MSPDACDGSMIHYLLDGPTLMAPTQSQQTLVIPDSKLKPCRRVNSRLEEKSRPSSRLLSQDEVI